MTILVPPSLTFVAILRCDLAFNIWFYIWLLVFFFRIEIKLVKSDLDAHIFTFWCQTHFFVFLFSQIVIVSTT